MKHFASIPDVIADIRKGRMVMVTNGADRENEGVLAMAAAKITLTAVNFMAKYAQGLICAPITEERARQLSLPEMYKTDFTVSVDASNHITTGICARDRAVTIKALASDKSHPDDLVQPGHVFPLQTRHGGILRRAGHAEAAVDLARMAGLDPSGVICEILNENGTMARLPDLLKFGKKHGLKMCSIEELIAYRRKQEKLE